MDNKLSNYTNGLLRLNHSLDFEEVLKYGFEFVNSESWMVKHNTETEVEIFQKDDKRLIRIISTIETESEGTLTYQSTWIDPCFKNYFPQTL